MAFLIKIHMSPIGTGRYLGCCLFWIMAACSWYVTCVVQNISSERYALGLSSSRHELVFVLPNMEHMGKEGVHFGSSLASGPWLAGPVGGP